MTEKDKDNEDFRFFWEDMPEKDRKSSNVSELNLRAPKMLGLKRMPINITQTEKDIIVMAELQGFKKSEISLNISENYMEITAQKKEEKMERTDKSYRHECSTGSLRRAFTLPQPVDAEKVEARLENGLLIITIPKIYSSSKKKRKIDIK